MFQVREKRFKRRPVKRNEVFSVQGVDDDGLVEVDSRGGEEYSSNRASSILGWLKRHAKESGKSLVKGAVRRIVENNIPQFVETVLFAGDEKSVRKVRDLYIELPRFYDSAPELVKARMKAVAYKRVLNSGYKNVGLLMSTPDLGIKFIDVSVNVLSPYKEQDVYSKIDALKELGKYGPVDSELYREALAPLFKKSRDVDTEKLLEGLWGALLSIIEKHRGLVLKKLRDKYEITDVGRTKVSLDGKDVVVDYVKALVDGVERVFLVSYKMVEPSKNDAGIEKEVLFVSPPNNVPSVPLDGNLISALKKMIIQGEVLV